MKWLPSPPTDNVYKFMAIFGLWVVLALVFVAVGLRYLQYKEQEEARDRARYYSASSKRDEMSKRLESIVAGRLEENKLDWLAMYNNVVEERVFLERAIKAQQGVIDKTLYAKEYGYVDTYSFFDFMRFKYVYVIFLFVGLMLLSLGFLGWYKYVQLPNEEMQRLDIELKRLEVVKLKAEITKAKRVSYSKRR